MKEIEINLSDFDKNILVGKKIGQEAAIYFKINTYNIENSILIITRDSKNRVINSSFFLGLLENIILNVDDKEHFYKHIKIDSKYYGLLDMIDENIDKCLFNKQLEA